jgi:protein phosphatase
MGRGARTRQQDALHVGGELWVVADGFGAGDDVARQALAAFVPAATAEGEPLDALDAAFARAHEVVEALAGGPLSGTTLTAVRLVGDQVAVAHVGDSRAWLVRDGRLDQLTVDHTEVQSLIEDGTLTEEEARSDPRRSRLNRAVAEGIPADPDTSLVTVRPGDRLLLTTDGTHAVLEALAPQGTPAACAEALASAVEEAGAPDNYAMVVVDLLAS